jgi:hypothetical protein
MRSTSWFTRSAVHLATASLLALTACGAAEPGSSQGSPGDTTHPPALFGSWFAPSFTIGSVTDSARMVYRPDGTCLYGFGEAKSDPPDGVPCTYSVAGADKLPSSSASWLIQMTMPDVVIPLEIVAIDEMSFTTVTRFWSGELHHVAFARE